MSVFKLQFLWLLVILMLWIFSILKTRKKHTHRHTVYYMVLESKQMMGQQTGQTKDLSVRADWTPHTYRNAWRLQSDLVLFVLFICLFFELFDGWWFVPLVATHLSTGHPNNDWGGKGHWYMMHQSNFIIVMNGVILFSLPPSLFYSHAEWQITHLSLIV